MINKKAWIRSDKEHSDRRCPFGLPIPEACQHAGSSITHMCPLKMLSKEKKEGVEKANKRVYIYYKEDRPCLYAANIIEKFRAVNCNFGDTAQGTTAPAFAGSPLYAQTFSGIGLDGLYAFPLGFYADNNESRNLFQGLFSLVGNSDSTITRFGGININDLLFLLENCREEYERVRSDPAKVVELINKYNPRKKL